MNSIVNKIEHDLINVFGYNRLMQLEDIIGIACALLLGHILTMLFAGYFHQKTIRDRKLAGFSVVRVDNFDGGEDKFRVNPHSVIENVDSIYNVFWLWVFGNDAATFHDLVRLRRVQILFIVLLIFLTLIGIALSVHVTDGNITFK